MPVLRARLPRQARLSSAQSPAAIELMGPDTIPRGRHFCRRHGFSPVAPPPPQYRAAIEERIPPTFLTRPRVRAVHTSGSLLCSSPPLAAVARNAEWFSDLESPGDAVPRARSEGGQPIFGDLSSLFDVFSKRPRISRSRFCDAFGNVVHLLQNEKMFGARRFPEDLSSEETRHQLSLRNAPRICETASGIARAAGYRDAARLNSFFGGGEFYVP